MKRRGIVKVSLLLLLLLNTCVSGQSLAALVNNHPANPSPSRSALPSGAPAFKDCCAYPPTGEGIKKSYTFDARSSQSTFDISHHKQDKIRILLKNKNPFLYDYTVTVTSTPVSESALGAFLPILGGPIGDLTSSSDAKKEDSNAKAAADAKAAAASPAARAARLPNPCPDDQLAPLRKQRDELVAEVGSKNNPRQGVEGALQDMKEKDEKIQADYKAAKADLENSQAECQALCDRANGLSSQLAAYSIADPKFDKKIEDLGRHANNLLETASRLSGALPECTEILGIQAYARFIAEKAVPDYQNTFKAIVKNKQDLDDAKKAIDLILSSPEAFNQSIEIGPFRGPTDVTIKVERKLKKPDAKSETIIDAKANFGGRARFALAGGLAVTNLEKREFQRIQPAQGDPVVGLKENSKLRVVPLVMLHSRLYDFGAGSFIDGFHLSVGVTAKNDNKGTDIEYLFGPSLSFAEERFFITGGAYAGKQQRLEGGFQLGTTVPMGVSELPTRKEYHWKIGVAFTYKIK